MAIARSGSLGVFEPTNLVTSENGDSLTRGHYGGVQNYEFRWQKNLEAYLCNNMTTPPTFFNNGVGGQTSTAMLAAVGTLTAQSPDVVFVMTSPNDPANAIAPATTASNFDSWLTAVWAAKSSTKVFVVSGLFYGGASHNSELVPDATNEHSADMIAMNTAVRNLVLTKDSTKVRYLDARAKALTWLIANNPTNVPNGLLTDASDGTHLTPLGRQLLSQWVFEDL